MNTTIKNLPHAKNAKGAKVSEENPLRPLRPLREEKSNSILRQWTGPLTQELVLSPGNFGLGKVPAKFAPDATTTMTCGFCSTGCGLKIHLRDGLPEHPGDAVQFQRRRRDDEQRPERREPSVNTVP